MRCRRSLSVHLDDVRRSPIGGGFPLSLLLALCRSEAWRCSRAAEQPDRVFFFDFSLTLSADIRGCQLTVVTGNFDPPRTMFNLL